jgi:hypothetical protein
MTEITIATTLAAPVDTVWEALQHPATLIAVSAPILRFRPIDPPAFPDRWHPGEWQVSMWCLGILPVGRQVISISIESASHDRRVIRDNGRGRLARRWDHRITVSPLDDGRTAYRDEVAIEAGALTPLIVLFARLFYMHRQRRWRALIARNALPGQRQSGPA